MAVVKQFDSVSTSYVNLAALIRHLREQTFVGTIYVLLNQYEAEVRLHGADAPTVSEIDPVTHRASETEGAMERLLVHAREPGGKITVYGSDDEKGANLDETIKASANSVEQDKEVMTAPSPFVTSFTPATAAPEETVDWADLLDAGGKVVGAVERAVESIGADFESSFRAACIQLGDDYPFLDPTSNGLSYANKTITLNAEPSVNAFVTALSECLRRITNKLAIGKESRRFRETVAIELAIAARMRPNGLGRFKPQLDRIAGTRVL
jgi:hypothetical protein